MAILQNKERQLATIHVLANTTVNLADLQVNGETVAGADISLLAWSGDWVVKRGTTNVATLSVSGLWDLAASGIKLNANNNQSLVFQTGTTAGTLICKVTKVPG